MGKSIFSLLIGILQLCFQSEEFLLNDPKSSPDKYSKTTKYETVGPKIIGGKPANIDAAKFTVSLRNKGHDNPFGEGHFCGGILISRRRVLTAAHCFFKSSGKTVQPKYLRVVMGTLKRVKRDESTLVFDVKKYLYHGLYSFGIKKYDIGMLSFKGIVDANNPIVQPINLTEAVREVGEVCQVMGWGNVVATTEKKLSDVLLVADVNILDPTICKLRYQRFMADDSICAGDWKGAYDACLADSGGPLVCDNQLTGIVSWGISCGKPQLPGVYTDIMTYRSWIDAVKKMDLDSKGSYVLEKMFFYKSLLLALFVFYS